MKYPQFLSPGNTIGYVAPSFGCNIEPYKTCFDNSLSFFESKGYSNLLGPNCYLGEGIGISNTPSACAKELMDMYMSRDCQILLSCGGGELMCETIGNVDFDCIAESQPKWYMGYSDNTNFGFLLTTLCDVASLYGPNAPAFGMRTLHPSLTDAYDILTGKKLEVSTYGLWEKEGLKSPENPTEPYNCTESTNIKVYSPISDSINSVSVFSEDASISATGRLVGGCLDCLQTLCGTKFDRVNDFTDKYKNDGILWFLESCDLNVYSMRRALWQLDNSGWFKYIKGLIIGRPLHFGEELFGLDQYEAILPIARKYQVPVFFDVDLGHLPPAMPIISGSIGTITTNKKGISLAFKLD